MTNERTPYLPWLSNLRAAATLAVILLHVSADLLYEFATGKVHWWTGNLYDSAVRFCVPVFVMITGALLLRETDSWPVFMKKRLVRLLPPFLFWSSVYVVLSWRHLDIRSLGFKQTADWLLGEYVNGSSYHLWYIYMILGMYLFIPFIGSWICRMSEKQILILLACWMITLFSGIYPEHWFIGYTGYLVLGYYLAHKFTYTKRIMALAWLLALTGFLITAFGTWLISAKEGQFDERLYSYLSPNVMLAAAGVFLIARNRSLHPGTNPVLSFINRYSYGIYLAHVFVLIILAKAGITAQLIHPVIGIPITTIVCLGVSALIVYMLRKLPYGKVIAG